MACLQLHKKIIIFLLQKFREIGQHLYIFQIITLDTSFYIGDQFANDFFMRQETKSNDGFVLLIKGRSSFQILNQMRNPFGYNNGGLRFTEFSKNPGWVFHISFLRKNS